jgi:hypothetical protein
MRAIAAFILVACLASSAQAIPREFQATLTISTPELATCIPDPPPGEGACGWDLRFDSHVSGMTDVDLTPGGALSQIALAAGLFSLHGTRYIHTIYGPAVHPIESVAADEIGNGSGSFGPTGGSMPLAGVFKYCLFSECAAAVANLSVPMSAVGASATVFVTNPLGPNLTVIGAPWTTGTLTAGEPPAPFHGSHAPGHLELVTPIYISTNIAAMSELRLAYARLSIDYVPEPASAVLLGLGIGALSGIGRARR